VLACTLASAGAHAADLHWRDRPYQILAADKPLPDFLRELAASQGTTAVIDPKVTGTLSGRFGDGAQRVLDSVCATNGLTWYFDGAFLYIEPASESRSEVIAAGDPQRALQTLHTLNILDSRYPVTGVEHNGQGTLRVAGPRRYVDLVRQAVRQTDSGGPSDAHAEVRVFPLKYAWAADIRINRNGHETAIPGVATLLRDLYAHDAGAARPSTSTPVATGASRELKLHSTGDTVEAPKVELPAIAPDTGSTDLEADHSGRLPQFEANTGLNAVIVRDLPERMGQYARLIESMDVRPRLVEIEVTIMDIGTDRLDSLGFDWRAHGPHADLQIGNGTAPPLAWGLGPANEVSQTGPTTPLGTMFSAAIGHDATSYLLARVNALAQTGDANLVARPKVLTLDNNEAVLENLQQFYVRVNGYQDASLFSVTTGTAVRVTPMIVEETSQRGVMMSIDIEDGDVGSDTVDQIPIIDRRTVNTQALVDEGQSLLIAGFSTESRSVASSGVPVLKDIPVIGPLFRFDQKTHKQMERFYLLTPRLVSTKGGPMPTLPDVGNGGRG
jgi:type III secretion protein C